MPRPEGASAGPSWGCPPRSSRYGGQQTSGEPRPASASARVRVLPSPLRSIKTAATRTGSTRHERHATISAVNPYQLAIGQTFSFLSEVLRGRQRILEVGCGRGEVARRLGAAGFRVTAIALHLSEPSPANNVMFLERDFLRFQAEPFDAVVFTSSLHHISPLSAAVSRAHALLGPGGLLVADDFDLDAPNAATLRWYYDVQGSEEHTSELQSL